VFIVGKGLRFILKVEDGLKVAKLEDVEELF
jgi:hypothetical protein